ncbi:hypothetical protein AAE478_001849 [Parahypoxylon ruwenzoriense]
MAGFSSWFRRHAPESKPVNSVGTLSNSTLQTGRIIHGRVTKLASTSKEKRYKGPDDSMDEYPEKVPLAMAGQAGRAGAGAGAHRDHPIRNRNKEVEELEEIELDEEEMYGDGQPISDIVPNAAELLARYGHLLDAAERQEGAESLSSEDRTVSSIPSEPSTEPETDEDYGPDEGWRIEQVFLNEILNARNEYTLMPSTWRMHFRGIPLPEGLFYVKTQAMSHRPRIYAHSDRFDFRGAMALRKLIDLHARVHELRKLEKALPGTGHRIVRLVKEVLIKALHWAELDGDIAKYSSLLVPNVKILEMNDEDRLDMDIHIQDEMADLATEWREVLDQIPKESRPRAPVLFGFVIFKHILFIVTLDAENPAAACHIPCQLNLSEKNQHQWNALAIMVTICWARDLFAAVIKKIPNLEVEEREEGGESSDPDA